MTSSRLTSANLHTVPVSEDGQRLDRYLKKRFPTVPFIALQKLLRQGDIRLNGRRAKPDARLSGEDVLRLPPALMHAAPNTVGLGRSQQAGLIKGEGSGRSGVYQLTNADRAVFEQSIIYEDKQLLVMNKPAGLAAQAGSGITRSLDRMMAAIFGPDKTPRLAHRLDRDTTGVIVAGKNRTSAAALAAQFAEKSLEKHYLVLVAGVLPPQGRIDLPLKKVGPMAVVAQRHDPAADTALTTFRRLGRFPLPEGHGLADGAALHLLDATPHTGRMNQLRAHFAAVGCPIVGDTKYGTEAIKALARQLHPTGTAPLYLHAYTLALAHPLTQAPLTLTAPPPAHLAHYLHAQNEA